jgi:hypothetical protein
MKQGVLFATVLCVSLAAAATAWAKGPTAARITGPGLGEPIVLSGFGESGDGSPLAVLTMEGGFFPATFGEVPDPMLPQKPSGELGPRYSVTYTVPGPSSEAHIEQSLFPYAEGGTLLYTPPNQPIFEGERTRGGWFRAAPRLRAALVRAGLPETAPRADATAVDSAASPPIASAGSGSGGGGPTGSQLGLAAAGAALAAAVGGALLVRRRRRTPTDVPASGR